MDHYLTTYKKDYLWPSQGSGGAGGGHGSGHGGGQGGPGAPGPSPEELAFIQSCLQHTQPPDCRCAAYGADSRSTENAAGWSRNEIMGPLLDPKLYPVRVGAAPEVATSRYDQPNAFLDKLQSKFPMLYSILQNAPSAELKERIERDRNKTTYHVDYCENGPGAQFANLQRAADVSGSGPCSTPLRLPGDPCRVQPKIHAPRSGAFTKSQAGTGGGGAAPAAKCDASAAAPPLGRTEYQDNVSKLGGIIMRDKIHRKH